MKQHEEKVEQHRDNDAAYPSHEGSGKVVAVVQGLQVLQGMYPALIASSRELN